MCAVFQYDFGLSCVILVYFILFNCVHFVSILLLLKVYFYRVYFYFLVRFFYVRVVHTNQEKVLLNYFNSDGIDHSSGPSLAQTVNDLQEQFCKSLPSMQ